MPSLREAAFPFLVLFAVGCSSAPDPQNVPAAPEAGVTNGVSNQVSVALASTHLGAEGCTHDESGGLKVMACASLPDGSPRGTGLCGGPCEYSSVQLSFASRSGSAAHIQITKVALVDAATGMDLQALTAYTPLVWNGTQYTPWDETIAASSQIKTSYTLSPPAWSTLDPSFTYSHPYKVRITILVDGMAVTLESPQLTRPAPLAT